MDGLNKTLRILDVPYYQQTKMATCGPASLMMVMSFWDSSLKLSRKMEFQVWRKSFSLFLFGGTYQFGLAATADTLGFKTEIFQKTPFSTNYPTSPQLAFFIENIVAHKARRKQIPISYGQGIMDVIDNSLQKHIPPLVLVNLKPLCDEDVLHWVVITGLDEHHVYMNDPYVPAGFPLKIKKGYPVPVEVFQKAITTDIGRNLRLPPAVVLVYK